MNPQRVAVWGNVSRADPSSKLETRLLLSRSEGGTVARAVAELCSAICACWVIRLGVSPTRVAHAATRGPVQAMARPPGGGNPDQSARRGKIEHAIAGFVGLRAAHSIVAAVTCQQIVSFAADSFEFSGHAAWLIPC
jgi:hypothetical protein